jgi:hypothetical protein
LNWLAEKIFLPARTQKLQGSDKSNPLSVCAADPQIIFASGAANLWTKIRSHSGTGGKRFRRSVPEKYTHLLQTIFFSLDRGSYAGLERCLK